MDGKADRLTVDAPVTYVIRVQGEVAPHWAARLGGLAITDCDRPGAGAWATTELRGVLLDQAALLGVLTTLYNLGHPLLAVACAPVPGRTTASASTATADTRREPGLRLPKLASVSERVIRRTGR